MSHRERKNVSSTMEGSVETQFGRDCRVFGDKAVGIALLIRVGLWLKKLVTVREGSSSIKAFGEEFGGEATNPESVP